MTTVKPDCNKCATCEIAVENGHFVCLKYAYENGYPIRIFVFDETTTVEDTWDEDICSLAASKGYLDCLKYARENGCPWDDNTCDDAAAGGYLECLKYAHENGCPWDEHTCSFAASRGHLECVKYAHENGCPCKHRLECVIYDKELDVKTTDDEHQCCICFDNEEKVEFKPCNHKVCITCSNTLITNPDLNCPYCRTPIEKNILF